MIAVVIHVQKQGDKCGFCISASHGTHFPFYLIQKSYYHIYEVTPLPQGLT